MLVEKGILSRTSQKVVCFTKMNTERALVGLRQRKAATAAAARCLPPYPLSGLQPRSQKHSYSFGMQ